MPACSASQAATASTSKASSSRTVRALSGSVVIVEISLSRVLAEFEPGDEPLVHLVGSVGETQCSRRRPRTGEGEVVGKAATTVDLDGEVDDLLGDARCDDLDL